MSDFLETQVDKFTFKVAADRLYTKDGVWALATGSTVRIGLSDFLQQRSGDIAFADIKSEGTRLEVGGFVGTVETIKVNADLVSPAAGMVTKVNPLMESAPEVINQDPYGEGWVCEIEVANWETDRQKLLDPQAYFAHMKQEAENEVNRND